MNVLSLGIDIDQILKILEQGGSIFDALGPVVSAILSAAGLGLLLISIPLLIYSVAMCFFGVQIYRILLVIQSVLVGGSIGAGLAVFIRIFYVFLHEETPKVADAIIPAVIGFVLVGALCGVAAWFLYMVFLFLRSFGMGFGIGFGLFVSLRAGAIITKILQESQLSDQSVTGLFASILASVLIGMIIGLILGIALGIVTVIFAKWVVMGTTAYAGGKNIGTTLALIVLIAGGSLGLYTIVGILLSILFIGGGFAVQFLMDKKHPCNIDRKKQQGNTYVANAGAHGQNRIPPINPAGTMSGIQPPQNFGTIPPIQQPQNFGTIPPVPQPSPFGMMPNASQDEVTVPLKTLTQTTLTQTTPRKLKLVGVDGYHKGMNFEINDNIVMGRSASKCTIIFPSDCAGVSRVQCELKLDALSGALSIVDNSSSFGTKVNGVTLERGMTRQLSVGDVIMFGENNAFKVEQ